MLPSSGLERVAEFGAKATTGPEADDTRAGEGLAAIAGAVATGCAATAATDSEGSVGMHPASAAAPKRTMKTNRIDKSGLVKTLLR